MRNRLSTSNDGSSTVTYSGIRIVKNGTTGEFTSGATPSDVGKEIQIKYKLRHAHL
jgi:hypothetical protein